jgi:hypothetical protein
MKHTIAFLFLLFAGCDPSQLVPAQSPAEVVVNPASGGGGTIEPAEIPIHVTVQVEQRRVPDIGQGQDHKLCVNCGCADPFAAQTPPIQQPARDIRPVVKCYTQPGSDSWCTPCRESHAELDRAERAGTLPFRVERIELDVLPPRVDSIPYFEWSNRIGGAEVYKGWADLDTFVRHWKQTQN